MAVFDSLTTNELNILVGLVSAIITQEKSADDNNVLGNFLAAVAANVLAIAAQQQNLQSLEDKQKQIEELKKQIKDIKGSL